MIIFDICLADARGLRTINGRQIVTSLFNFLSHYLYTALRLCYSIQHYLVSRKNASDSNALDCSTSFYNTDGTYVYNTKFVKVDNCDTDYAVSRRRETH